MSNIVSAVIGYLLGCLSPAAFLGRKHNLDLRQEGTGNLGATNTAYVLGKGSGLIKHNGFYRTKLFKGFGRAE